MHECTRHTVLTVHSTTTTVYPVNGLEQKQSLMLAQKGHSSGLDWSILSYDSKKTTIL